MKPLAFLLAIVFIAVIATVLAIEDPGYVLIARTPWSVEMPLTLFVVLVLIGTGALFLLGYLAVRAWLIPRTVVRWHSDRRGDRARSAMNRGLLQLAAGNWAEAEAALTGELRHSDAPLINFLGAAYAAQQLGKIDKRDEYLAKAHAAAEDIEDFALSMTQARLQHLARQFEQELATLTELRSHHPRHQLVLQQLADLYRQLGDWGSLAELLPALEKGGVLDEAALEALRVDVHRALLSPDLPPDSTEILDRAWEAVPKRLRRAPALLGVYVRQLMDQQRMDRAESVLRAALNREWDESLVRLYGRVRGADPQQQLRHAEAWLQDHPGSPGLLLGLGRLANEIGQLDKARGYLEKAGQLVQDAEVYEETGKIFEKQGNVNQALRQYRHALSLALDHTEDTDAGPAGSKSRATPADAV